MAATVERKIEESVENQRKPARILLFSGKRKSGKDFITDLLRDRLTGEKSAIIKISRPIKSHWAESRGLDIDQLLGDGEYKEKHRLEMVKWSEEMRRKDYGCFCRAAVEDSEGLEKRIWIVSDVRRKSDVKWFKENYGEVCRTIRIVCDEEIRKNRGFIFTPGIDDCETECDLDDFDDWDLVVENNREDVQPIINKLLELVE